MSRYRRYRKYRSRGITEQEKFQWGLAIVIFIIAFIFYFVGSYFSNCIFEWPPRWDVKTCFNEQINPAKEKAAEKAANFVP